MSKYITLLGAETVSRASSQMDSAADKIGNSVSSLDYSIDRLEHFLNDWLERFQTTLKMYGEPK
jgi:hypothetical protein